MTVEEGLEEFPKPPEVSGELKQAKVTELEESKTRELELLTEEAFNLPLEVKPSNKEACDQTYSNVRALCNPPPNAELDKACKYWYKQCPYYKKLTIQSQDNSMPELPSFPTIL